LFDFLLQNLFMPLQNRVNPFSEIIAAPERGGWTGNRGVLHTLPDAVFIKHAASGQACLWYRQHLYQWSFSGYQKLAFDNASETVEVLTPASYVEVMRCGYAVQVDGSVGR
jgi:hypothetical protein